MCHGVVWPLVMASLLVGSILRFFLTWFGVLGNKASPDFDERRKSLAKKLKAIRELFPITQVTDSDVMK